MVQWVCPQSLRYTRSMLTLEKMIRWKLRALMADKRISNKALSVAIGCHENTISNWRQSDELPKIGGSTLTKLCTALSCEPWDLIEWTSPDA